MLVLYILTLLLVISLVLWPYEKIVASRIITVSKIAKRCRKRGINFKVLNRAYPFSKNTRDEFDFILRIGNTVIPVKFFSSSWGKSAVVLDPSGKICTFRKYVMPLSRDGKKKIKTVKNYQKMPNMKISKKIIGDRYRCFPIFLNEPRFESVLYRNADGTVSNFYEGAYKIAGCNFMDGEVFGELIGAYDGAEKATK